MSRNDMVSVVVPVYNVEKYINQCVESIINQTYRNIEIILVDDGSTDTSGIICDEWKQIDNRVRVIHKANGGLSSARNVGIDVAKGEYIGFVDSDDYIATNMYELLIGLMKQYDVDVARCSSVDIYNEKAVNNPQLPYREYKLTSDDFYIECVAERNGNCVGVCNKLYKKDIFAKAKFKEGIYVEDYYFLPELISTINMTAGTTAPGYYYIHRKNGITGGMKNPQKQIRDRLAGCRHNEEVLSEKSERVRRAYTEKNLSKYFVICRIANVTGYSDKNTIMKLQKILRGNFKIIVTSKILGKGIKRSYLFWYFFPHFYYYLFKRRENKRYGGRK